MDKDGVDDNHYINLGCCSWDREYELTMEIWIKATSLPSSGNYDYIWSMDKPSSYLRIDSNGQLSHYFGVTTDNQNNHWPTIVSSQYISTNTWYHVAVTYSDSRNIAEIYIGGVLDNSITVGEDGNYYIYYDQSQYFKSKYYKKAVIYNRNMLRSM